MKRNRLLAISLIVVATVISDCGDEVVCPKNGSADPASFDQRVVRTNEFAFELYQRLIDDDANVILAPHSITTAFGMVYAGARGLTEKEIANVMRFNYPQAGFHRVMGDLNELLQSRGQGGDPEAFELIIANSAWGQTGETYLRAFRDTLALHYRAPMRYVDFIGDPEGARQSINTWVSDNTRGYITDLIRDGQINPATWLVLANTIFFNASWLDQFDPQYTATMPFTLLSGSTVNAAVMRGEPEAYYSEGANFIAAGLPYEGEECAMILILPDEGHFPEVESALTAASLDTIVNGMTRRTVRVQLPKFSFQTRYDLERELKDMGMTTAFRLGANFSGMDGSDDGVPWIDFVAHKVFIQVDEFGTLAAAGTAVGLTLGVAPEFYAVRPFLFFIRDNETGTVLFMGRVLNPAQH